jgi:hypothetical protein
VLSLPAWPAADGVIVADPERSCCLALAPSRARLVGDPGTRRWRFTSMLLCHEIAATRLRGTCLDVHAAAVEVSGRAVLIVGPKGAGKTTLALHLLRSGLCGMMANDRAFVGCESGAVVVRGVPTAVKVRPSTQAEFPELRRDLPPVERPYLYTLDELAREASSPGRVDSTEFALSPAQLARQLRVTPVGTAPLGAVVFPEVRADLVGWAVERLDAAGAGRRLFANLYGGPPGRRGPTIFEELDGGGRLPSGDLATELARTVPAYRVTLGSGAYAERRFAERLLKTLGPA